MTVSIHPVWAFVYVNECGLVAVQCGRVIAEYSSTTQRNALRVLPVVVVAALLSLAATLLSAW